MKALRKFCRAEMAVVVALLHDVLDDTQVSSKEVVLEFGPEVAEMVEKVSSLSSLNQLLRRNKRQRLESLLQVPPPPPPLLSPSAVLYTQDARRMHGGITDQLFAIMLQEMYDSSRRCMGLDFNVSPSREVFCTACST